MIPDSSALSFLAPIAAVVLFQSTVLLLVGFLVAFIVGPRRLALLSLVYRLSLVGLLFIVINAVAPIGTNVHAVRPAWQLSLSLPADELPQMGEVPGSTTPAESAITSAPVKSLVKNGESSPPTEVTKPLASSGDWLGLLIGFWFVVAVGKLIWLVIAGFYAARLRRARPVDDPSDLLLLRQLSAQLQVREPVLVSHSKIEIPFLSGLLRPVIGLPQSYKSEFDTAALKAILLHELAHLLRRDCWWRHLANFVGAVLWIQPLV
ncbi:MAG: hypothetical protein EON95_13935, partial [Caulobacteraceae bacterium]